jgi:hypothetical protein
MAGTYSRVFAGLYAVPKGDFPGGKPSKDPQGIPSLDSYGSFLYLDISGIGLAMGTLPLN